MIEPMHRRPRRNGDEQDAFSRTARRALCCLQRAGVVHATKTRAATGAASARPSELAGA